MKRWMFLRFYFQLWWRQQISVRAAALTYTTTLALVPALAIIFAAMGLLVDLKTLNHELRDFLYKNLSTGTGSQVVNYLESVLGKVRVRTLGTVGFGTFLVTSLMMIANVESAINRIWGIRYPKKFWRRFFVYNVFLIIGPLCAALSISVSTVILKYFPQMLFPANLTSVVVVTFFVGTVYKMLPNRKVSWGWALLSALFVAIAIELAKWGYSIYTARSLSHNKIYGALAVLPFFLIWIYVNWIVFLSGALLHYILEKREYYRSVATILLLAFVALPARAGMIKEKFPTSWYVQRADGEVAAIFSEELELREKGNQVAVQQHWHEKGKETLIGSVAQNGKELRPEAFYVEVKGNGQAYSIDGRMRDKQLKVKVKHLLPANLAEETANVREEKGMILSVFLPEYLVTAKAEVGMPIYFNAVVEDTQDGSYEPKVGKALYAGTEKIGTVTCKKFLVTFQEIKSQWYVEPNGKTCRIYFPKNKTLIERTTEEAAKKALGSS